MLKPVKEWEAGDIIKHMGLRRDPPIDKLEAVRRVFSDWRGMIEQSYEQSRPPSPVDVRRMEYYAAEAILKVLDQ